MHNALSVLWLLAVGNAFTADGTGTQPVAAPTAYPDSGTYAVSQRVTLECATPGARIFYTTDGTLPSVESAQFDPYRLIFVDAEHDGETGLRTECLIRAFAVREGMPASPVVEFRYVIQRRDKHVYVSREIGPGLRMIADFDDDKMFLVTGSQRALLIDTGMGSGDLKRYVEPFTGGRLLDVVITHAHPDHVARIGDFQTEHDVYMHPADLPMLNKFTHQPGHDIDPALIKDIHEGFVFDLGDIKLQVFEVPGHTPGSIVLFDEARGILIAGDAVGSNRPTIVDAVWLQKPGMALADEYLSTLQAFRPKVRGKLREIYTGHNDAALIGEVYLDHLQQAAQNLVDQGEAVLAPSLRPPGVWQVVVGERKTDSNWAAINVNRARFLSTQPK
jgi:glyoxylase-like metal-dependent hydrolase (beta-lactamase superfamily II)